MRVKILGKTWHLETQSRRMPADHDGFCDAPNLPSKTIRIRSGLGEKRQLEVVLHELLHAADWHKDETWVEQVAEDVAAILWKLGYRLTQPPER